MTLPSVRLSVAASSVVLAVSMLSACAVDEPAVGPTVAAPQQTTSGPAASPSVAPPEEIAVGERIYDEDMRHGILVVGYSPSLQVSPDFAEGLGGDTVFLVHLRIDAGQVYRNSVASHQFTLRCDPPVDYDKTPLDTDDARAEITAVGLAPMPEFGVEAGQSADVWLAFAREAGAELVGCGLTYGRGELDIIYGGSGTIESFTQTVQLN